VKRIRNLLLGAGACLAALSSPALAQNEEIAIIPVTELTSSNGATVHGVSYDGRRIVFESNNNYTGENADANFEIFVYDADTRRFIQLTKT
jgi:Tol biopolymer transport system component